MWFTETTDIRLGFIQKRVFMDIEKYFRSISSECEAMKNRVRMFIHDKHWQTDGEWKESVLRSIIRRSAPDSVTVGRGFVVAPTFISKQIDVLVYDKMLPVLYRDGDLAFVSPESCRAIVEVKSKIASRPQFLKPAEKLASDAARIREATGQDLFVGLFAYESSDAIVTNVLDHLLTAAAGDSRKIIDHVAAGSGGFTKYWRQNPVGGADMYNHWHRYELNNMAAGYFVHNLVIAVTHQAAVVCEDGWFPINGIEPHRVGRLAFN